MVCWYGRSRVQLHVIYEWPRVHISLCERERYNEKEYRTIYDNRTHCFYGRETLSRVIVARARAQAFVEWAERAVLRPIDGDRFDSGLTFFFFFSFRGCIFADDRCRK